MRVVLQSKSIPAVIGLTFGGLWALLGAMALPPGWRTLVGVVVAVATALLVVRVWRAGLASTTPRARLFGRKAYQVAVVAEIVAIYAASILLPRLGWQAYFVQSVGIIVGLHFIGLWAATRSKGFLGITGGMCIISATAVLLPGAFQLFNLRDGFTGFGNALVLWLGASRSR